MTRIRHMPASPAKEEAGDQKRWLTLLRHHEQAKQQWTAENKSLSHEQQHPGLVEAWSACFGSRLPETEWTPFKKKKQKKEEKQHDYPLHPSPGRRF